MRHEPDGTRLVSPTACHPVLDPMVQTFLDRHAEGSLAPLPHSNPDGTLLLPAERQNEAMHLLVYLQDIASPTREPAMQLLADQTGFAVLLHPFPADAGPRAVEQGLLDRLDRLTSNRHGITPAPMVLAGMVLAGDGLGALAATAFASRKGKAGEPRPALLVLATPVLDRPAAGFCTEWLPTAEAQAQADTAMRLAGEDGWPAHYPRERLLRMPPTVLITADMDPFRDGAEGFARRLMAADMEVSASRLLGTIHDFTWLPGLVHACAALGARCITIGALNVHRPVQR